MSTINSLSLQSIDGDYIIKKYNAQFLNNNFGISFTNYNVIRESFYWYIDANFSNQDIIQNNKNHLGHFEIKNSGLGFQNKWFNIELGKGRQVWGAGSNINLAVSQKSNPYDYFMLSSDYGLIRVNYFHGFLEGRSSGNNRYINGRGLEWTNKKSLIIALSEIIIYSGQNRSLDLAYLNPIGSHLEIELNDRLNFPGDNFANAVWQFHLDWLIKSHTRFSLNYLFDEMVLDPDIEVGKENGKAYSIKIAQSIISNNSRILNIYFLHYWIGTPAFRHGNGYNNFVQKEKPLGWQYGSDGDEISLGIEMINVRKFIFKIEFSKIKYGTESIIYRPYDPYKDYLKGKFPSGELSEFLNISNLVQWRINYNYEIKLLSNMKKNSENKIQSDINIQLKFNFPNF